MPTLLPCRRTFPRFSPAKRWTDGSNPGPGGANGQPPTTLKGRTANCWSKGYAFDSVIPQSGYTHTELQADSNGGLDFAGICIETADTGEASSAEAGRLLYTPIRLEETEAGWRVTSVGAPL